MPRSRCRYYCTNAYTMEFQKLSRARSPPLLYGGEQRARDCRAVVQRSASSEEFFDSCAANSPAPSLLPPPPSPVYDESPIIVFFFSFHFFRFLLRGFDVRLKRRLLTVCPFASRIHTHARRISNHNRVGVKNVY